MSCFHWLTGKKLIVNAYFVLNYSGERVLIVEKITDCNGRNGLFNLIKLTLAYNFIGFI